MAEVEEAETCDCGKHRHFRFVKWCEKHCIQTAGGRCKFVVCLLVSVLCSGGIYQKSENKTKQSSKTNFPSNIHPGVKQITGWFGSVCLLFVFCCVLWIYLPNAPRECVFVKTEYVWWTQNALTNQQTTSKAWISWTSFNNRAQVVSPVVWPMDGPRDWKWEFSKNIDSGKIWQNEDARTTSIKKRTCRCPWLGWDMSIWLFDIFGAVSLLTCDRCWVGRACLLPMPALSSISQIFSTTLNVH